jgi:hypothetical protein
MNDALSLRFAPGHVDSGDGAILVQAMRDEIADLNGNPVAVFWATSPCDHKWDSAAGADPIPW